VKYGKKYKGVMIIIPCSVIFLTRPPGYTLYKYLYATFPTRTGGSNMATNNRYLSDKAKARSEKAITAAEKHATKSRDAQDAVVTAVVGATYVTGVYTKAFVTTYTASRKTL
jgi:hypothetical protein